MHLRLVANPRQFSEEDAWTVGELMQLDWMSVPFDEWFLGLNVEIEHYSITRGDPRRIGMLVLEHLYEDRHYYSKMIRAGVGRPLPVAERAAPKRPREPDLACTCKTRQGTFSLGKGHQFGMRVPSGSATCTTCRFVTPDLERCTNPGFISWRMSLGASDPSRLPYAASEYACDVYEPR
jgi:hypothetical protein